MLILGFGLKAKFLGLGIGLEIVRPWPRVCGLGLECSGLRTNHKAIRQQ